MALELEKCDYKVTGLLCQERWENLLKDKKQKSEEYSLYHV